MTSDAWRALLAEIDRLDAEVAAEARQGLARPPGADPERRRRLLEEIRDAAVVDDVAPRVGIGRCVTVTEDDGETTTYCLVLPGDGDPSRGHVSADSPLGAALLGASVGDEAAVDAPAGRWSVRILRIA